MYLNTNLFEEVKFDSNNIKETKDKSKIVLKDIGNRFGFNAETLITNAIINGRTRVRNSARSNYDIIVELKTAAMSNGRYYHSRSDLCQLDNADRTIVKDKVNEATNPLDGEIISDWFIKNLNRIVACEILLDFASIDKQAMDLEVSLKQFQNILAHVDRSSTGDYSYRSNSIAKYGTETSVVVGLSEYEKEKLKDPNYTGFANKSDREIVYTIKHDWNEKVFKNNLQYINLNSGKIAAVLDAEPETYKAQDEETNLWKLTVAYVKVPREICLWRSATQEEFQKCIHFEELFYAEDKYDSERCATGTTAGRAIGTLNRRAKKEMFNLMGLDNL